MKNITKLIEGISKNLKDGDVDKINGNLDKIKSSITDLNSKNTELQNKLDEKISHISDLNSESAKNRRKAEKLNKELETKETDYNEVNNSLTETENKLKSLNKTHNALLKTQRNVFINTFDEATEMDNFDNIKSKLTMPEFDKENEKFLTEKLNSQELESNYNKINEYKDIGYLTNNQNQKQYSHNSFSDTPTPNNLVEMAKNDPKAYAEYMKNRKL